MTFTLAAYGGKARRNGLARWRNKRMAKNYDLLVIGGGPAGLMAAKTAAEMGLEVCVVERKKTLQRITRTCCASFYLEADYMSETTQFEKGKLHFPRTGFSVDYSGSFWPIREKFGFSPGGYKWHMVRFESPDYSKDTPLSVVLDKEALLGGLLDEVKGLGVEVMTGVRAERIENAKDGVRVEIKRHGQPVSLGGKKGVVADGVNSRMVDTLGLNAGRKVLGPRALFVEYVIEGVENPHPNAVVQFAGEKIAKFAPLLLWPNSKGLARLLAITRVPEYPTPLNEYFMRESPYASWFARARVVEKTGGTIVSRSAISEPCVGNIMIIGDAAAFIEVENQGAMMCGFKVGKAVVQELGGRSGFEAYTDWWKQSFEFNNPELLKGMAVIPLLQSAGFTDSDLDYLHSLVDGEDLFGTCSQYRSGAEIWKGILRHGERIEKERPVLYEKVKGVMELNIDETF
jgi:flavin-dependent dehydrogenase